MQHNLVDFYQVCSNNAPGVKMAPPGGHMFYMYRLISGKHEKIFLSKTLRSRALIFGMSPRGPEPGIIFGGDSDREICSFFCQKSH